MKSGIKWKASHPPGVDRLDPDQRYMGYPLKHIRGDRTLVAQARGVWPRKWIAVGDRWFLLTGELQQAVLLHEVGHLKRFHLEKRLAMLPFFWTPLVRRLAWRHEMEADEFATRSGYGQALARFIGANHVGDGEFYPPFGERMKNICNIINEVNREKLAA